MGLILDSTELIAAERAGLTAKQALLHYGLAEQIGISVISLAELQHGVERAVSPAIRYMRERFLSDLVQNVPIYPVTAAIALQAGSLDAALQKAGQRLAYNDLFIAATAMYLQWTLVTRNRKHFARIPGLHLR